VSALASHFPKDRWSSTECRVERNVHRILELMHQHEAKGTFFTLGWIAERYPKLVRLIAMEGHEIASHGYGHERASDQTPEAFLADIQLAKVVLEDIADCEVRGYRAPSFSVGYSNPWAHDCIEAAGYAYSSSVYPVKHDHYGVPDAPRFPTRSPRACSRSPSPPCAVRPQLAGGRRWLLPPAALPGFGVGHPQGQRRRPSSGDLLLPPLGDRSRPAGGQGGERQDPLPPLRESRAHRSASRAPPAGFRMGADGRRVSLRN
jgi:polysaccharide deacetylase family protein (PEP-CTERM system associated)